MGKDALEAIFEKFKPKKEEAKPSEGGGEG
jgi:hypothetical protein